MLENTSAKDSEGFDFYMDASGDDNWDNPENFYLTGMIVTGPREQWVRWMEFHMAILDGNVHFSAGVIGEDVKFPKMKDLCKAIIARPPWAFAFVTIHNKRGMCEHIKETAGFTPTGMEISASIWSTAPSAILGRFIPHINRALGRRPDENILRKLLINNPTSGDRRHIAVSCEKVLHRTPEFVSGGHPGIDAIDGLLWGLRRFVELGKSDAVPWEMDDEINKQIMIFGIQSHEPKYLKSLNDILIWRAETLSQ